jgi:hypothetical protein
MEVQNEWLFAAEYSTKYNTLPPSQQREAAKRLTTRRRNPLTPEQCRETSPDIEAVLEGVYNAYNNKKLRSKASSATRRATIAIVQKEPEILEPEILEPESEVSIVCVENVQSEPLVQPPEVPEIVQPVQPLVKRSKPIPIPVQVVVPKINSSGLASMLRGRAR